MLTFDDLAREVEQSGLFDADWYVKTCIGKSLLLLRVNSIMGAWIGVEN